MGRAVGDVVGNCEDLAADLLVRARKAKKAGELQAQSIERSVAAQADRAVRRATDASTNHSSDLPGL